MTAVLVGQTLCGQLPPVVTQVARDSRAVTVGAVYIASSTPTELAAHVDAAVHRGAVGIISETKVESTTVPLARTSHARWSFAHASAATHGLLADHAPLLAVTGTAGKSTTTHFAWWALGPHAARVGTIGWHDGQSERPSAQTTPPPEDLHAFLRRLPSSCPGVALEASSHAAEQQRLAGLRFTGLAFTGLGHDHLDYHHHRGAYLTAKLRLARQLQPHGMGIVCADAPDAAAMAHVMDRTGARVVRLGFRHGASRLRHEGHTWFLTHDGVTYPLPVRLPGDFNAWNAAAGALLAHAAGVPLATACARLADVPAVPGRLELLAHNPATYVDFAHTPDELTTMLRALRRDFPHQRVVCVFGCGGDRDRTKRAPMMAAALLADDVVLTSDNSRSEDPRRIADDALAGVPATISVAWLQATDVLAHVEPTSSQRVVVALDRGAAIRCARQLATRDGIVVVAGKGHETNLIVGDTVLPWDDRTFVRELGALS